MGMDAGKVLEELQFLLEEDNRVITYKFVSENFGIHVNEAKSHLESLWKQCQGKGDDDVTATFFVSGLCEEGDGFTTQKCLVVSADQLASARGSLSSVTSEHVFSVQRHKVCSSAVLYGADLQEAKEDPVAYNSHGAITNPRAERIPEAELLKARQAAVVSSLTSQAPVRPKPTNQKPAAAPPANQKAAKPSPEKKSVSPKKSPKKGEAASGTEKEKAKTAQKGGSIATMFAKAATTEKKTKSPPKKSAGGGMMSAFLKKGAEHPEKKETTWGDSAEKAAPAEARPAADPDSEPEAAPATVRFGAKRAAGGKRGAPKKRAKQEDGAPAKQRRRILAVASDSSESSGDEAAREPEPEQEPEPEPEPKLPPPLESDDEDKPAPQARRKRKLVSKTFVDEEGFMVTKKEYESCSESDTEGTSAEPGKTETSKKNDSSLPQAKQSKEKEEPASAASAKPKEASHHKTKQPNIMSFFKKK